MALFDVKCKYVLENVGTVSIEAPTAADAIAIVESYMAKYGEDMDDGGYMLEDLLCSADTPDKVKVHVISAGVVNE